MPTVREPHVAVWRLFDLADEIDTDRVAGTRFALRRSRSGAVRLEEPPVELDLGDHGFAGRTGRLRARVYPFGVVALAWRVRLGERLPWDGLESAALELVDAPGLDAWMRERLAPLRRELAPALARPLTAPGEEGFYAVHVQGFEPELSADALLQELDLAPLVLGERVAASAQLRADLARHAFSYSTGDLALLGFDGVFIYDQEGIWDVADLVEWVHAELLELDYYDGVLARALEGAPQVLRELGWGRYGRLARLRRNLMERRAEITEVQTRLAGALRITEDLFYARIHRDATEVYGAAELAGAVQAKLQALNAIYQMVSEEMQFRRSQAVEVAILALIALEVVWLLLGRM